MSVNFETKIAQSRNFNKEFNLKSIYPKLICNCRYFNINNQPIIGNIYVRQNDSTEFIEPCIAQTRWGNIPGKCKGNKCWFPYGGREHEGYEFNRILGTKENPIILVANNPQNPSGPPEGTLAGMQNDSAGLLYAAIANTQWGEIPGKAKGNECWFPYGGYEEKTNYFFWIVKTKAK